MSFVSLSHCFRPCLLEAAAAYRLKYGNWWLLRLLNVEKIWIYIGEFTIRWGARVAGEDLRAGGLSLGSEIT